MKHCRHCQQEISPKKKNIFCNSSCAASYNNKISIKKKSQLNYCKLCSKLLGKKYLIGRKYCEDCSKICRRGTAIANKKQDILDWIAESSNKISNRDIAARLNVRISTWMKWNRQLEINYVGNQSKTDIPVLTCDQVFRKGSLCSTKTLKNYLFHFKLMENRCKLCNIIDLWNDQPISLHLDHINGDNSDNELTNLRLLCPNCHSQTDTYCSRNKKREKKSVSDEELLDALEKNQFCVSRALKSVGMSGAKNYVRVYKLLAEREIAVNNGYNYPRARADITYTKFNEARKKKVVPQAGLEPARS